MLLSNKERIFEYIPENWEEYVRQETLSLYDVYAKQGYIPCLDDSIVNHLTFYHTAICHQYYSGGEVLVGNDLLIDGNEWVDLREKYSVAEYPEDFLKFRDDVKSYLNSLGLFYEENWVFMTVMKDRDYVRELNNIPLQSVW